MPAPILPNQLKEIIPSGTGSFCSRFLKILTLPKLLWEDFKYRYNEDGTPSDEFCADLRTVCECTGDGGGGTGPVCPTPAPANVVASNGTYSNKVLITWDAVTGATRYDVYRSILNDKDDAIFIGSSLGASFDDDQVTLGTSYYYWVRAVGPTCTSAFSASDQGYSSDTGALSGEFIWYNPGSYQWTVPDGITVIDIEVTGGGGKGGSGSGCSCTSGVGAAYSGGGGGGGYAKATGVSVTPGEIINLTVGYGGGMPGSPSVQGSPSIAVRASDATILCQASGGNAGVGNNLIMVAGVCSPQSDASMLGGGPGIGIVGDVQVSGIPGLAQAGGFGGGMGVGRGGNGGVISYAYYLPPASKCSNIPGIPGSQGAVKISW